MHHPPILASGGAGDDRGNPGQRRRHRLVRRLRPEGDAFDGDRLDVGDADEGQQLPQIRLLEVDRLQRPSE
jgi:hypothetical protein